MWCTADTGWSKAGTSILFGPWSCGATVVFHDGRFDPRRRFDPPPHEPAVKPDKRLSHAGH